MDELTARDEAFDILVGHVDALDEVIEQIDQDVASDRKLTAPLRTAWLPTQRASTSGGVRFNAATRRFGQRFDGRDGVVRSSTPNQEARQIFLWTFGGRVTVRIKRHPEDIKEPGNATLFSLAPKTAVQTVFLRWDVAEDGKITHPTFICRDEPAWSIPLHALRDEAYLQPDSITVPRMGGPRVSSTRADEARREQE